MLRFAEVVALSVAKILPPSFELDDLIQIARIETWRKTQTFDASRGCSFSTYAWLGVRGACLMFARRNNWLNSTADAIDDSHEASACDDTEARIQFQQLRSILGTVVDELMDERQRHVVVAYFVRGLDVLTIADELSCSQSNIRLIRQQAYAALRTRLEYRGITVSDIDWQ